MNRKSVGLALSGGAARGFAHLGVLKALTDNNIPIDMIAGSSAGSIVGGAFASGMSVKEIIEMSRKVSWYGMSSLGYSIEGLLSNAPMGKFIEKNFPSTKFEDLKIPFAAVAGDLENGEEVVLKETGDLALAIRASCAIPGIFTPVEITPGHKLVDGGIVTALPIRETRRMGADVVIAVDVIADGIKYWGTRKTMLGVLLQSGMMLLKNSSQFYHSEADVVIIPKIGHLRPDEMGKLDEFVRLGEEAALEKIDEIRLIAK
jgi:NTE family protein